MDLKCVLLSTAGPEEGSLRVVSMSSPLTGGDPHQDLHTLLTSRGRASGGFLVKSSSSWLTTSPRLLPLFTPGTSKETAHALG